MLISCVTPTADRREFWPRCARCFLSQDHPEMEWVVVDNGKDSVRDLVPEDPRVRYFRVGGPRLSHGALMNVATGHTSGEVAIVVDDDDWYAPDRVRRQTSPLLRPEIDVVGTSALLYYLHGVKRAFSYRNITSRPWMAAIAFRRTVWEAHKFEDVPQGADTMLLDKIPRDRWLDLKDEGLLVSAIHPDNAAPKMMRLPSPSFIEAPWERVEELTKGTL